MARDQNFPGLALVPRLMIVLTRWGAGWTGHDRFLGPWMGKDSTMMNAELNTTVGLLIWTAAAACAGACVGLLISLFFDVRDKIKDKK